MNGGYKSVTYFLSSSQLNVFSFVFWSIYKNTPTGDEVGGLINIKTV